MRDGASNINICAIMWPVCVQTQLVAASQSKAADHSESLCKQAAPSPIDI